jgi:hypothetical protein
MKFINKFFSVACLGAVAFSCADDSTLPYDQEAILNNQGAFVRLESVVSGEFDLNDIASSSFGVELEAWDAEGGNLLDNIELTVQFIDNTPGNGTNNVAAAALGSFPAASFTNDAETGLPNITLAVTANDAMTALGGLVNADLDGGDVFRFEWKLNLTNGKSFDRNNQSNSLSSWPFYNSPFLLDVGVVCLLPDGFATGSYAMTQTEGEVDVFFGEPTAFYEGDVMLIEGASSTERLFDFSWISFGSTMGFNLVCGNTAVSSGANPGASCGGGIVWFTGDGSGSGTFDGSDDSVITLRFWDDYTGDCGLTAVTELTLTKN